MERDLLDKYILSLPLAVRDHLQALSEQQKTELLHQLDLAIDAKRIAEKNPDLELSDILHSLQALELPLEDRLRRGLRPKR